MMRAIWTDEGGDEIEVNNFDEDGEETVNLVMSIGGKDVFGFTPDDAESFAAYLRAWALKQREGV